jgi:deazaflavin-dependent oxidoreductase (nitroreductase family)
MDFFIKLFTRFNAFLVRATPLSYYRDGTRCLVVASKWGQDNPSDWLLNLQRQPAAAIQVNGRSWPVEGRPAAGDEPTRPWTAVTERNPQYR